MHFDRFKVKLAMARQGYDINDLATAMGCSRQNVNFILNRKENTTKTVHKMAKALKCDPADIVAFEK